MQSSRVPAHTTMIKRLALFTTCLALVVVILGAYTRLKDAGLGCPDWPGCYGHWTVPHAEEHIEKAQSLYPDQPIEHAKAWAEMIHRYFASTLGFFILVMAIHAWRYSAITPRIHRILCYALLVLVILQGLLGKYTVTMGLHPGIVMLHLLGGFFTLTMLSLLTTVMHFPGKQQNLSQAAVSAPARPLAPALPLMGGVCIMVLLAQIALGGWTSANYAARSCPGLPACMPQWTEILDFKTAFAIPAIDDSSYEHAPHLDVASKITIQMTHRIGAVITMLVLGAFYLTLMFSASQASSTRQLAVGALALLCLQFCLGLLNIVLDLPLLVAVAHNAVAALSLISLVLLNYSLYTQTRSHHEQNDYASTNRNAQQHSLA